MSYDLYFYKRKGNALSEQEITEYLTTNLATTSANNKQWFVENENTETYFSIEHNETATDEESIELFESFQDFDNTHFSFNLNFLRPDFFGQYAFEFVEKFVNDLDLYVLNPQSSTDADNPFKPQERELYENWSAINAMQSAALFDECELIYYPLEKSNAFYQYNYNKERLQQTLGDECYVPKLYLFQRQSDGAIVTLNTWTQHIPNVFPPADYILLNKEYKKRFRTIEESGLISAKTFHERFGHLLSDFDFEGCKVILPDDAEKSKDIFNSTKFEYLLDDFGERAPMEKIVNSKPNE